MREAPLNVGMIIDADRASMEHLFAVRVERNLLNKHCEPASDRNLAEDVSWNAMHQSPA
jgi:hypothetical protein